MDLKKLILFCSVYLFCFLANAQIDTLEQTPKFKKNALKVQFSFPRPLIGILGVEYERELGRRTTWGFTAYYGDYTDGIDFNGNARGIRTQLYGAVLDMRYYFRNMHRAERTFNGFYARAGLIFLNDIQNQRTFGYTRGLVVGAGYQRTIKKRICIETLYGVYVGYFSQGAYSMPEYTTHEWGANFTGEWLIRVGYVFGKK
jgi:hypothetical protein